jgi:hypothetical protein
MILKARLLGAAAWILLCSISGAAPASEPPDMVVVGSVDPLTNRVSVFEDLLVKKFLDGGKIHRLYGGYDVKQKAYYFVRAGKNAQGRCLTEVFALTRVSGNRLAIADESGLSAWNPVILQKHGPTFDCVSVDCFSCEPGGIPQFGEQPECGCSDGGRCNAVKPGTASYGARDLAVVSF